MNKNIVVFLLLLGMSTTSIKAQEYRTDESIASQLKNNRQPGMRYGESPKRTSTPSMSPEASESLSKLIKEGRMGGLKPATGMGAANSAKPAPANIGLASEQQSDDLRIPPAAKPSPVPQQAEEAKQETPKKD